MDKTINPKTKEKPCIVVCNKINWVDVRDERIGRLGPILKPLIHWWNKTTKGVFDKTAYHFVRSGYQTYITKYLTSALCHIGNIIQETFIPSFTKA